MSAMYFTEPPFFGFHQDDEREASTSTLRAQHALEQRPRPRLVERLVEVPALGALHARRATARARAAREQASGVLDPALEAVKPTGGDPHTARMTVVDEDRRSTGLEVDVGREPADVPAVAHRPEREQRDKGVLGCVERPQEDRHPLELLQVAWFGTEPDSLRLEGRLRHEHRHDVDRRAVPD